MNCKVLYNARCYAEKRFSTCTWVNWFLQSVIDWYSYWLTHCECWSTVLSRSPPPCTSIRQVGKMTIFAGASRWFQMRFFYVFLLSKLQGCTKSMCSIVFWAGWNMLEQTKRIHVARRGTSWHVVAPMLVHVVLLSGRGAHVNLEPSMSIQDIRRSLGAGRTTPLVST